MATAAPMLPARSQRGRTGRSRGLGSGAAGRAGGGAGGAGGGGGGGGGGGAGRGAGRRGGGGGAGRGPGAATAGRTARARARGQVYRRHETPRLFSHKVNGETGRLRRLRARPGSQVRVKGLATSGRAARRRGVGRG